jgi:hypothetical protein
MELVEVTGSAGDLEQVDEMYRFRDSMYCEQTEEVYIDSDSIFCKVSVNIIYFVLIGFGFQVLLCPVAGEKDDQREYWYLEERERDRIRSFIALQEVEETGPCADTISAHSSTDSESSVDVTVVRSWRSKKDNTSLRKSTRQRSATKRQKTKASVQDTEVTHTTTASTVINVVPCAVWGSVFIDNVRSRVMGICARDNTRASSSIRMKLEGWCPQLFNFAFGQFPEAISLPFRVPGIPPKVPRSARKLLTSTEDALAGTSGAFRKIHVAHLLPGSSLHSWCNFQAISPNRGKGAGINCGSYWKFCLRLIATISVDFAKRVGDQVLCNVYVSTVAFDADDRQLTFPLNLCDDAILLAGPNQEPRDLSEETLINTLSDLVQDTSSQSSSFQGYEQGKSELFANVGSRFAANQVEMIQASHGTRARLPQKKSSKPKQSRVPRRFRQK